MEFLVHIAVRGYPVVVQALVQVDGEHAGSSTFPQNIGVRPRRSLSVFDGLQGRVHGPVSMYCHPLPDREVAPYLSGSTGCMNGRPRICYLSLRFENTRNRKIDTLAAPLFITIVMPELIAFTTSLQPEIGRRKMGRAQ